MQIVVSNLAINYSVLGKGKKVVLLHGWGDSVKGISPLIRELSNRYEVIAVDLPGFGGSETPLTPFSLEKYAIFVRDFLNKIELTNLHLLIGHSNGGAIASYAVANNYFKTDKLILLASSGIRQNKKNFRLSLLTKTGKVLSYPMPASFKKNMRAKFYQKIGSDLLVAPAMEETFKKIITEDIQKEMPKIKIPTLLLYADDDDQTPFTFGEQFHELLSNSTLEIVHGGGHFFAHTNPKLASQRIREFDQ